MYHPTVINRSIEDALKRGKISSPPTYHNRFETDQFASHLKEIYIFDDEGTVIGQSRELTPEEVSWIRNERFLCRVNYNYFASNYVSIRDADSTIVPYKPWISQRIVTDIQAEMELEGIAINIQALKARQLGVSRDTSIKVLHRACFLANTNAVVGSSTPDKTDKLGEMLWLPFERLPHWLIPQVTANRRNEYVEFGKIGSSVQFQHGAQFTGIARGTTPNVVHLSELAEFIAPEDIVDSALMRAYHDTPRSFMIQEGTAEGQNNWWHKSWILAKKGWPQRRTRLRPMFLPWFVGTDLYPSPTWLKGHPIPGDYLPAPWAIDHAERASRYVADNDLLTKYLGSNWKMPIEQIWFYEVSRQEYVDKNNLRKFLQEMPANDDEAFQSTNVSIFTTEVMSYYRDHTKPPKEVYGIMGPENIVRPRLQPHPTQIDPNRPPVNLLWNWHNGYPIPLTLVPLKRMDHALDDGLYKLYLWEHPIEGKQYGFGLDTSEGVGEDRTAIEGIRKGDIYDKTAQVCEFASDRMNAMDSVPIMMAVLDYFSVKSYSGEEVQRLQARAAIECKGNGDQAQLQLRNLGWTNFHPWVRIDSKKMNPSQAHKIGVFTNSWFRAGMMEFMLTMIRDNEIDINSKWLVEEMQSLNADDNEQAARAEYGAHDDRFMSLGFPIISLFQHDRQFLLRKRQEDQSTITYVPNTPSGTPKRKIYAAYSYSLQEREITGIL